MNRSSTYNEISEIHKFYKFGTLANNNIFMEEEGKDEEDFQSPIKLGVKSVDLNDANCKNYQKLLKNDKKNIF